MEARPLALLGVSVLRDARLALLAVVETWRADWGLDSLAVEVECRRAWEENPHCIRTTAVWNKTYFAADRTVSMAWEPDLADCIQRNMFASDRVGGILRLKSIASECASGAIAALAASIANSACILSLSGHAGDSRRPIRIEDAYRLHSGAVSVCIRFGNSSMQCLINHASVRAMARLPEATLPAIADPVDLRKVLRESTVSLRVDAGHALAALGSLATIRPGDVIRLQEALDEPLRVHGPDGNTVFRAYLGMSEGKLAVEAMRHAADKPIPGVRREHG